MNQWSSGTEHAVTTSTANERGTTTVSPPFAGLGGQGLAALRRRRVQVVSRRPRNLSNIARCDERRRPGVNAVDVPSMVTVGGIAAVPCCVDLDRPDGSTVADRQVR